MTLGSSWKADVELESGERLSFENDRPINSSRLPIGYHTLRVTATHKGHERQFEQRLIVAPRCCTSPTEVLGDDRAFGLTANLYTIRSNANWGIGDFSDLGRLATWGGERGADFVGVNPLHALMNRGTDISPYSPVSRLFRNALYIDVTRVPEFEQASDVRERIDSPEFGAELEALRETDQVRYEQVLGVKGIVLGALHRAFEAMQDGRRHEEYRAFVDRNQPALSRFATWMAIAERHGCNWREWPKGLGDRASAAVRDFAREHRDRVAFHQWLQFEADRQLSSAATAARDAGMRIGLYQDLAIGTSPVGADTWAFPELFAERVAVGAPPDPYSATGQNWGLPPLDPRELRRTGYAYFIDLIRGAFRHSGALRIDHVLGLFRLFWIPDGTSGEHGAYVRYPTNDLLGILALESVRNRAIVVGEDLGTVPPEVPRALEDWGILSSKVMLFERGEHGSFNPPSSYQELALATANTHDMAPIAGYWSGVDVEIRERVGLTEAAAAEEERRNREVDRRQLRARLVEEHLLSTDSDPSSAELRGAVHAMMCRTPSRLVGLSLDDVAGETQPVNVPGVGPDQYPSWSRKMRDPLDVIMTSRDTDITMRCDGRRGVRHG
jgi:4-alpha-glucanotransferase